jgi:hypothetical protein
MSHHPPPVGGHTYGQNMLVIKVELWPGGWSADAQEIGRAAAASVAERDGLADYLAVLCDGTRQHRTVHLTDHRRAAGVWPLLARIAEANGTPAGRGPLEPRWWDVADQIIARMYE